MTIADNGLPASQLPTRPAPPAEGSVAVLVDPSDIGAHLSAWQALAADALEPNPFYEPWMLLPALSAFASDHVMLLLVYLRDRAKMTDPPILSGLFPLEFVRRSRLRVARLWKHRHCYLCTPLLRASAARPALAGFFDWLTGADAPSILMEMPSIPADGPFHQLLIDELRHRSLLSYVTDLYTRPVLRPRADAEAYLQLALSGHRRRNINRREKQLATQGPLQFEMLHSSGNLDTWTEEFLRLEASGWKAGQGTALACADADREFFHTITRDAFAGGQLIMRALHLNGRPIAMRTIFLSGEAAFLFKPAYDEAFARFSPGILLDIHTIRQLHETGRPAWVDSCTTPDNAVLNELWLDRRAIQNLVISTGKRPGDLLVSSAPLARWVRRKLRPGPATVAAKPARERKEQEAERREQG